MKTWITEFAPYGAGSPPALVLALNLYKSILTATSADMWPLAALTAVLGVVFTIAIEAGTYKALALAFASREWKAAFIAATGALTVTALIIFGVYSGAGTRALITSSVVMVAGYLVIMLNTYMGKREMVAAAEMSTQVELQKIELEKINAEKNRINAETRKAKAALKVSEEKTKVSESFASTDWRSVPQADREKIRSMTVKEIMATYNRSERTAQNWKQNSEKGA